MFLHENRDLFKDTIQQVSAVSGKTAVVIEKDYYVTLILNLLATSLPNCVFKGGTSLSKGYHVIDRFSEDIDITFDSHIGKSKRKRLKYETLKGISETLGMPISNWDTIQSDRDYNAYHFSYLSVFDITDDLLLQYVKLETALGSYAFPTQNVEIRNYIGDYFEQRNRTDLSKKFSLSRFPMKLQALERTFIDKIFALCDYYLQGKSKRYSRHLYDIYKLTPKIAFDDSFKNLVEEVRIHRTSLPLCPSAQSGINLLSLAQEILDTAFYQDDYQSITMFFTTDYCSYDDVINNFVTVVKQFA